MKVKDLVFSLVTREKRAALKLEWRDEKDQAQEFEQEFDCGRTSATPIKTEADVVTDQQAFEKLKDALGDVLEKLKDMTP